LQLLGKDGEEEGGEDINSCPTEMKSGGSCNEINDYGKIGGEGKEKRRRKRRRRGGGK